MEIDLAHVLASGARVVVERVTGAQVVSVSFSLDVGAASEVAAAEGRRSSIGAAHFVEHMLFKGTKSHGVGEIDEAIDALGGEINAYTTHDQTLYYADAQREHWRTIVSILSEMVCVPTFDRGEFDLEKEVILEEVRGSNDDPNYLFTEAQAALMWRDHGYERPVAGSEEDVASLSYEDVVGFWREFYKPENLIVLVAGDVSEAEVVATLERTLACMAYNPDATKNTVPSFSPQSGGLRTLVVPSDFQEAQFELLFAVGKETDEDAPLLEVLSVLLASDVGPLVGPLQMEKQIVTSAWAQCSFRQAGGAFFVGCTPNRGEIGSAIKAMWEVVQRFLRDGPTKEQVHRAKITILAERRFGLQTVSAKSSQSLWAERLFGDSSAPQKFFARVGAVTVDEVLMVARKVFVRDRCLASILMPEDSDLTKLEFELLHSNVNKPALAPPKIAEPTTFKLPCGVTLLVDPRVQSSVSAVRVFGMGGRRFERVQSAGLARVWCKSVSAGVGNMNTKEFTRRLEMRGASVGASAMAASMQVGADTLREDLDEALEWAALMVRAPRFDTSEVERFLREMREWLSTEADRPAAVAWKEVNRRLFGGHPYGLPKGGTERSLENVTARQIKGFHGKWARAENLVISVVGCPDVDRAAERVESLFSGMRTEQYDCDYSMPPRPTGIRRFNIRCGREQSRLILAMLTQGGLSEDRFALMHVAEILGGSGGRLFTALRERSGVVYDVDASFSTAPEFGLFSVELTTDPLKLAEAEGHVFAEMERFATEGPSREELSSVAAKFAHSFASRQQRASSRAGDFALWERIYGEGFKVEALEMNAISRVSKEEVQRVMGLLLEKSSGVLLSARPV